MTNKEANRAARNYLAKRGASFVRKVPVKIGNKQYYRLTFALRNGAEYEIQVSEETLYGYI